MANLASTDVKAKRGTGTAISCPASANCNLVTDVVITVTDYLPDVPNKQVTVTGTNFLTSGFTANLNY
jgi:hypothetical protein